MAITVDNGTGTDYDVAVAGEAGGKTQVVALDAATLSALEQITATIANWPATQPVSGTVALSNPTPAPETGLAKDATLTARLPSLTAGRSPVITPSADLWVTAVGAAAAAVTLTLPAAGASTFHHINRLEIVLYNTAARTGGATPVTVTTTNLPGSPAFTFPSAGAVGTVDRHVLEPTLPIRSNTANTATTVVCPGTTGVIWRVNASYAAMA